MELIAGLAVIITLLICLGFTFEVISAGFLILVSVAMGMTGLFFIYAIVRILLAKRVTAVFSRIGRRKGSKFESAFYTVDGEEYPNIFPCEVILRDKFYKRDVEIKLRLDKKNERVFDKNAVMTCFAGAALCFALPAAMMIIFM